MKISNKEQQKVAQIFPHINKNGLKETCHYVKKSTKLDNPDYVWRMRLCDGVDWCLKSNN